MPRVMTDADINDFVKRYRSGETLKQLMTTFNIGHGKAVECLAARGLQPVSNGQRSRKLNDKQSAELVTRYQAGEGTEVLGAAFGISSRAVTDYLRRAGIGARPKHHGITRHMAELTHEERSAMTSTSMRQRWERATPEQRARMLASAHSAVRGSAVPEERKERIAATRAERRDSDSIYETQVARWLHERGIVFTQQTAVGPYNLDFAVDGVAVEITTGWARKKQWRNRFARLFDEGWHLYVIWHDTRVPLLPVVADDLVAWLQVLKGTPSETSEHRVIWRSRQILSAGGGDADYVAGVLRSSTPRGDWALYDGAGD